MPDQIANSFNREGLQQFAFSLGLDWEELEGTGKTARVRDVIVQLGWSGWVAGLVDLVREERPHIDWPDVPPAKQQTGEAHGVMRRAIRSAKHYEWANT